MSADKAQPKENRTQLQQEVRKGGVGHNNPPAVQLSGTINQPVAQVRPATPAPPPSAPSSSSDKA